jgi:hypothetical protein
MSMLITSGAVTLSIAAATTIAIGATEAVSRRLHTRRSR